MNEKEQNPGRQDHEPEIVVNQYGQTKDPTVVIEEADRTVLLTPDETLIIEKEPTIPIVPKNRPRNVYGGMWGRNEIITVALASLAFLIVVLIYFFEVIPSNRELARHKEEADNLKTVLATANDRYGSVVSTEDQVAKIVASETDFETRYLPPIGSGRNELYQRLNSLIDDYGLTNTSGPDYAPLEMINQQDANSTNQTDEQRGREKFRSLFPGVYVSMTVEGSYQNLRRFIKDIEAGQEFIVISSVQLTPSDSEHQSSGDQQKPLETQPVAGQYARPNPTGPPGYNGPNPNGATMGRPQPVAPPIAQQQNRPGQKGKMHGEVVSLHLEMAAYFRRASVDAILPPQ
jgi:Tfp pilus assembly protein PilO